MLARQHYQRLDAVERKRLLELVRHPRELTPADRSRAQVPRGARWSPARSRAARPSTRCRSAASADRPAEPANPCTRSSRSRTAASRPRRSPSASSGFLAGAERSLDLALYDVRLPGAIGDRVADAIRAAHARGVRVRIVFNQDERPEDDGERPFFPAPPRTEPHVLETLGVPVKPIPGWRDLMHHKYVVRDGEAVWTGSMNWTLDSWTRQENAVAIVASRGVAAAYARNFGELWDVGRVGDSGDFDAAPADGIRPWFCPGRGPELSHRIAKRIGAARRRVRIATPLLTAGPILGTLAEVIEEDRVDVAGVCDATQVRQVFGQWAANPHSSWKGPLLARCLVAFHGKRSDALRAGVAPRLHARQGHRGRRHRVPGLVQPLALRRDERGERAGDRRRARSPTAWRRGSTSSARASNRSPYRGSADRGEGTAVTSSAEGSLAGRNRRRRPSDQTCAPGPTATSACS